MKTFKDFKKKIDGIMEYSTLSQTGAWQTVNGTGSHHIDQDKALAEVNMFIARNLDRLFTDPVDAINMLRSKLNFVGFDFTPNLDEVYGGGTVNFPVTRHGGSFGTKPDHDLKAGFYKGDGIPGFKLSLSGSVTMESTGYRISLKMTSVPGEGQTDPDIVDSN
jgi:hypothetical protein